ncbi:MAG: NAD(P)H-hydrate dehydratase [Candidatus Aenigmarchaeota archaeon]
MKAISRQFVRGLFKKRRPWCHKGDFGHLLVIGGSKLYSGSPALAAMGAIKVGADLVLVAAPKRAADIIAGLGPDMITYPLKGDYVNAWHLKELLKFSEKADAVVMGGGMGKNAHVFGFVPRFLKSVKVPCVVDADAIHAFSKRPVTLRGGCVFTPHSHEFFILSGTKPSEKIKKRTEQVKALAKKLNATVLLKGHIDVISDGRQAAINKTGNPCMTKGGTGDTLVGILGGLLARGTGSFDAACASAWINGRAGDIAAKEFGEGLMAMDVVNNIHKVIR